MSDTKKFTVVGIGASAGGLNAVQQLFDELPDNSGIAFIIIQHLSPDFKSLMPELLAKYTKMKIFTAKNNQVIKPNCIYLNERSTNLQIRGNKLHLLKKAPKGSLNLPIDIFFHTLGEEFEENSYGVILSGTGSDGSRGIKTIKEAGGTIIVQNPSSAQFDGMPNSAISTNLADFVLNPKEISRKIIQLTNKRVDLLVKTTQSQDQEKIFDSILELVYKHSGVNFRNYKNNTLLRRLEKRMSVHNIDNLSEYLEFIKENPHEKNKVYLEFLIGVTSFFRDPEAFNIIKNQVLPVLTGLSKSTKVIRIWVPGCSTGEEVYSLAILFYEFIKTQKLNLDFKIFATDIDKNAINYAGTGIYPVNNIVEIDKKYLDEYFLKAGDKIQIIKPIREKVVFSFHDVTKDPPFIRMDLISCRNLLIYLNQKTQKKVLSNFQYALNKFGYLFLGSSESLGFVSKHFEITDTKWKIFRNISENARIMSDDDFDNDPVYRTNYLKSSFHHISKSHSAQSLHETSFYKYLSKKNAPTSVFIDSNYDILFVFGDVRPWFSIPSGLFQNNLLKITQTDLATILRNGVRRVISEGKSVIFKKLQVKSDKNAMIFDLSFERIIEIENINELFLIEFRNISEIEVSQDVVLSSSDLPDFTKQRIDDLELELTENRSELQNVVEELETSNEELQSSNEELMSSNEELQSSNEELQSVNEELYTVNTELQEKNKELENLNNDISNLLTSSDVGTLFLDSKLNIRKFTPVVTRIFKLEDSDIGRSIVSFASEFDENERKTIISNSEQSLEKLKTYEREVQDNNGNWFLLRINPFVTSKKKIDGVVLTFIDINQLKKDEQTILQNETHLKRAQEITKVGSWYLDVKTNEVSWTEELFKMYGFDPSLPVPPYTEHMKLFTAESWELLSTSLDKTVKKGIPYELELKTVTKDKTNGWMWVRGEPLRDGNGEIYALWGAAQDITKRKETELQLIEAQRKAELANIYKNQFLANMSHEIRTPMNGLVGFANLLKEPNLNDETKDRYIEIINSSSQQLLNLINDIVDVSKIEARELKVDKRQCVLYDIFRDLDETFNEIKKKKGKEQLDILLKVPKKDIDLVILTDPDRLQQVISNLINNAIKFTEQGKIEFGYKQAKDKIEFYVKDTGIGIPKEKVDVIFERFEQLLTNDNHTNEGTGLGLSISKGIVDLLGGTLKVRSEESVGSTFSFEIPLELDHGKKIKQDLPIKTSSIKALLKDKVILIAEDELINIEYFKALFDELPGRILFASNGLDAIDVFESEDKIDLILMDIRMPIMNGYDTAMEILKRKPDTKIIAQTAYAMVEDKNKYLESGFIDYISKPINKKELLRKLSKWIVTNS